MCACYGASGRLGRDGVVSVAWSMACTYVNLCVASM